MEDFKSDIDHPSRWNAVIALPVAGFFLVALLLLLTGLDSYKVIEPGGVLPLLNAIFLFMCPMAVVYVAGRGYMESGSLGLIMLLNGVFSFALGSLIAGFLLSDKGPNAVVTIHNCAIFLAGLFHMLGVLSALMGFHPEPDVQKRKRNLLIAILSISLIIAILVYGILWNVLPIFFVQGQGPTVLRQFILGTAALFFMISGIIFLQLHNYNRSRFLYWYSMSLFLVCTGLCCIFLQKSFGSPIGWTGRIAQYVAGLYLLTAVLRSVQEFHVDVRGIGNVLYKLFRTPFEKLLEERTEQLTLTNERLCVERERTQAILSTAMDGFWRIDPQTRLLEVNETYCKMSGYSRAELLNMSIQELEAIETPTEISAHMQKVMAHGEARFETKHRRKDGSIFDVEISVQYRPSEGGQRVVFLRDITEDKQIENTQLYLAQSSAVLIGEAFFEKLAEFLARTLNMDFVCIDRLEGDRLTARTVAVWHDGKFEDNVSYALKDTPCGDVVGQIVCCFPACVRQLFPGDQVLQDLLAESYVGATLWSHTGQPIGLIAVIGRKSLTNRTLAEKILKMVAVRAAGELERLEAEKTLTQSKQRLELTLRSAGAGTWDWDMTSNRLNWSRELYTLFGLDPDRDKATFETWDKVMHPEDKERAYDRINHAIKEKIPLYNEYRIILPDGGILWINALGNTTYDESGQAIRMIGICTDITERKRAEEALKESELKNREMLESITDAFFSLDDGLLVRFFNPAAERLLHRKTDDVIDQHLFDAFPEARGSVFEENYTRCIRTKTALSFEVEFTVSPYENWYEVRVYPAKNGISVFFQVTTERKRLEKERLDMERQLLHSQKLESLGVLAGGIAHDFNNLLMTILGNMELAMDDISPVSPARPYLENAHTASKRAADLTRQMLAYSGKGKFVIENMNLSELVQENIRILRASISATINLSIQLNSEIPPIMADAGQIQQVVMNLLTNAAEAIGDDAGTITLTTGVKHCDEKCLRSSRFHEKPKPGEFVYLEVTDTGCGMDEKTQAKIFDPFFTTKFTGRGLGMAAMQGIILGHKGGIFVSSMVGKGTTIRVNFPISDSVAEARTAIIPIPDIPSTSDVSSPRGTILIVDDEEDVRKICSTMVARLGYQTLTAADGEEAVAVFQDHADEIGCIILDMTMPKMDGYAAFQSLKQIRSDVKAILSSGYNQEAITQRFTGLGLAGFIQKPYRRQQLQDELERVMKGG